MCAFRLTQSQWAEIKCASGLPEEARGEIEGVLDVFRFLQQNIPKLPRTSETQKKLRRIARQAAALVRDVKTDRGVLFALLDVQRRANDVPPRRLAHQLLGQRCREVERLREWALAAAASLSQETTIAQKRTNNQRWLVSQLDAILFKHTNKKVSRSSKWPERYVTACFRAADPRIGSGSIDEAIKEINTRRRSRRGEIADDSGG